MSDYTSYSKDFYRALADGKLIGSHCKLCGSITIPQKQICPQCQGDQSEIFNFKGDGNLVAFTVISVPPVVMAEAGYDAKNPYCSGIVELLEGPRISAQILDVDVNNPDNIKIGTPLKMTIITRGNEECKSVYLAFKPESKG